LSGIIIFCSFAANNCCPSYRLAAYRTSFEQLIQLMVESDLENQERLSGRRRGQGQSR
jgi:hypothetical protein